MQIYLCHTCGSAGLCVHEAHLSSYPRSVRAITQASILALLLRNDSPFYNLAHI